MSVDYSITVDSSAVARIRSLRPNEKTYLRIGVDGGGCSGFQYRMGMTDQTGNGDTVFADVVVMDAMSLEIMNGSVVRFKDDLMGAQFVIDNPNATSGCGCGASFSVDMG